MVVIIIIIIACALYYTVPIFLNRPGVKSTDPEYQQHKGAYNAHNRVIVKPKGEFDIKLLKNLIKITNSYNIICTLL